MLRIRLGIGTATLVCLLLTATFTPHTLLAQIDTGGITGTVTDPSGAVVPGATITLTNDSTGVSLATKSTSTGTYSLNAIRPGSYTLRGEAPGFQTFIDNGLQVHVQNTLTIDIKFATGAVQQQVTVTAAAPLLQAENAAVGQTITSQTVNDLPLNGRNWDFLIATFRWRDHSSGRQPQQQLGTNGQRLLLGRRRQFMAERFPLEWH